MTDKIFEQFEETFDLKGNTQKFAVLDEVLRVMQRLERANAFDIERAIATPLLRKYHVDVKMIITKLKSLENDGFVLKENRTYTITTSGLKFKGYFSTAYDEHLAEIERKNKEEKEKEASELETLVNKETLTNLKADAKYKQYRWFYLLVGVMLGVIGQVIAAAIIKTM